LLTIKKCLKVSIFESTGSIYWKIPSPPGGGEGTSAVVIWGKKYEKGKKKKGVNVKENRKKGKEKRERKRTKGE
jgi:hypothetical protein